METKKQNIYQKLLEVKKQVPYIEKNKKKGNGLQYSYASPSQVLAQINPILNNLGLFLKTEVINCNTTRVFAKRKGIDVWVNKQNQPEVIDVHETLFDLNLKFTWVDVETGEKDENLFSASGVNGDEKGLGSALTYAERYFLLKTFNIPTDDDDPDAFQDKHMSNEEKQRLLQEQQQQQQQQQAKALEEAKAAAIAEMNAATDMDNMKAIWSKYKVYQTDDAFIAAKDQMKEKYKSILKPENL